MRELNIDFEEKYKEADNFIKDAYNVEQGITSYINSMEEISPARRKDISSWDNDYKQLKHLRWIRNQLAHSVSIDSDLCQAEDYAWIYAFCNRLYDGKDPLGLLIKHEKAAQKKTYEQYRQGKHVDASNTAHSVNKRKKKKKENEGKALIICFLIIAAIAGLAVLIAELI